MNSMGRLRVGIVGATTEDTPRATSPTTFRGLSVESVAAGVAREAQSLRRQGVDAVVLALKAGLVEL
jgi:2',3'-cyclic-nucleotide 2'-phosphodiesterase (5'-nucleotidase family)